MSKNTVKNETTMQETKNNVAAAETMQQQQAAAEQQETAKPVRLVGDIALIAEKFGINAEGFNIEQMNSDENIRPLFYLLCHDEDGRNIVSLKKKNEKLEDLQKKADKQSAAKATLLQAEIEQLQARQAVLKDVAAWYVATGIPNITPLAATYAYDIGTRKYGNDYVVEGRAEIMAARDKIKSHIKNHLDDMQAFVTDENSRHGTIYRELKTDLSECLTKLYGRPITAQAADVVDIIHDCTNIEKGTDKNKQAIERTIKVKTDDVILRSLCKTLVSKLKGRAEEQEKQQQAAAEEQETAKPASKGKKAAEQK